MNGNKCGEAGPWWIGLDLIKWPSRSVD